MHVVARAIINMQCHPGARGARRDQQGGAAKALDKMQSKRK